MIVFEFMFDMMPEFGARMDQWATGKFRHVDNKDDDQVFTPYILIFTRNSSQAMA